MLSTGGGKSYLFSVLALPLSLAHNSIWYFTFSLLTFALIFHVVCFSKSSGLVLSWIELSFRFKPIWFVLNESTCLGDFLKENNVTALYACGIGRENTIKHAMKKGGQFKVGGQVCPSGQELTADGFCKDPDH